MKGRTVMWSSFRAAGVALCALGLAAACGKATSAERQSGETHFLLGCTKDSCGDGLQCLCGVCSRLCDDDSSCDDLGEKVTCVEHTGDECQTVTKSCDLPCVGDGDCRSISLQHECRSGSCRPPAPEPAATLPCTSGCGNSSCGIQGSCDLASTCDFLGCSSAAIDADGCYRQRCQSDEECATDERCAALYRSQRIDCVQNGASCECIEGKGFVLETLCSPIALAGMRGAWQTLFVSENGPGVPDQYRSWTLTPDGAISIVRGTQELPALEQQLSQDDRQRLARLVDGPDLRRQLSDTAECKAGTPEYAVNMVLELSNDGRLAADVTECLVGENPRGSLQALLELVQTY